MRLRPTNNFDKRLRKLPPNQRRAVSRALELLAANPHDARLRTHKVQADEGWACSYAYDGRILFDWDDDLITLLDLGTHNQVY